jgi:anti-sigma B factor antagonist
VTVSVPEPTDPPPLRPGALTVQVSVEEGQRCIELFGELDIAGVDALHAAIEDGAEGEERDVVLDMSGLAFMDSSGLRAILLASGRLAQAERTFGIVKGPPVVHRVFELTGSEHSLPFL